MGTQPPLPKKRADNFWPISIEANRLHGSRCHFIGTEVGLDPDDIVLYGTQLSLPKKGAEPPPQFLVHVCCGQTAGWIKMALGMKVGLGPGHIVLDDDPAPLPKRGHSPQFSAHFYCDQTAGCTKMPLGMEVGLSPGDFVLDVEPAPTPELAEPPIFGPRLLWPNSCMDQSSCHLVRRYSSAYASRRHCVRLRSSSSSPKGAQPRQFLPNVRCGQTA